MSEDVAGLIVGAIGLLVAGGACYWVRRAHLSGELALNEAIGVRTKYTKRSTAAWMAGHDAAAPWLLVASWVAAAFAVAVLLLGTVGGESMQPAAIAVMLAGYGGIVCAALASMHFANSAAKSVNKDDAVGADTTNIVKG